jgi:hypothetical protein
VIRLSSLERLDFLVLPDPDMPIAMPTVLRTLVHYSEFQPKLPHVHSLKQQRDQKRLNLSVRTIKETRLILAVTPTMSLSTGMVHLEVQELVTLGRWT